MENSENFGRASVRNLVRRFENQSDGPPRTNLIKFKSKSSSSLARPRAPLLSFTDEIPIAENNNIRENASFKERRSLFEKPGATFALRRTTSTNLECLKLQEINEISKKADEIVFKIKKSQKVGSSVYISYLNEIVELLIQIGEIDTLGNASVQQEKLATLQVLQKCYFQLKDKIQVILDDGSNELEEVELLQIKDLIKKWEQVTEKRPSETSQPRDRPPPPPTTPKPVHVIADIHYEEHLVIPPNVIRPVAEIKPVRAESRADDPNYKVPKVRDLMSVFQSSNSEERSSSSKESSPSPTREIKNQPPLSPYKYVAYAELKRNESVKEDSLKAQPALQVSSYVGLLNSFSPKIEDDEKPPAYEEAIRDPKIEESLQIKIQEIQDDIEAEISSKARSGSPVQIEEYEEKKKEETISIIITTPEEQQDKNVLINETETDEEDSETLIVPNELIISYQKALENELLSTISDHKTESTPNFENGSRDEIEPIPNERRIKYEELSSLDPKSLEVVNEVRVTNSINVTHDQLLEENELKSIKNVPKSEDPSIEESRLVQPEEIDELQGSNEIETNVANIRDAKIESYELIQAERAFYTAEEVVSKDVKLGQLEVHVPISYLLVANDDPKEDVPEDSIWTAEEPEKQNSMNQSLINLLQQEEESLKVYNESPENKVLIAENNSNLDEYNPFKNTNSTIETDDHLLAENSFKNEEKSSEIEGAQSDELVYARNVVTPKKDDEEMEEKEELITTSEGHRSNTSGTNLLNHLEKEDNYEVIKNEEDFSVPNKRTIEVDEETRDENNETQTISKDDTQKTTYSYLEFEAIRDPQHENEPQTDTPIAESRDAKIETYEFIQAERAFYSTIDKDAVKIDQLEVHVPISYLLVAIDEPREDIPEDSTWTADKPENIMSQESFIVNDELSQTKSQQAKFNPDNSYLDEDNSLIETHDDNNLIGIKNEDKNNQNEMQEKGNEENNEEEERVANEWRRNNGSRSKQDNFEIDDVNNDKKDKANEEDTEATPKDDDQESTDPQNNNEIETRTHTVTTNITVVSSRKGVTDSIINSYDQLLEENGLNPLENSNVKETVVRTVVTERVVLRKQESVKSLTEEQNNATGLDNSVLDEYNNLKVTNSIIAAYDQLLEENNLKSGNQESIKPPINEETEAKGPERNEDLKSEEPDLLKESNEIENDVSRASENIADRKENAEEVLIGLQRPVEEESKVPEKSPIKKEIETTSTEDLQENVEPSRTKRGVTDSIIASYDLLLDENGLNQDNVVIKNIQKETVVMRRHQRNPELIGIESFDPLHSNQEQYPSLYNSVNVTNSIIAAYDQLLEENDLKSIRNEEALKIVKQSKEFAEDEGPTQKLINTETQLAEESDEDTVRIKNKTQEEKPLLQSTSK